MADWSDDAFRERVHQRARELDIPLAEVLRQAGLSQHFLQAAVHGRRIESLEKLARALGWSFAEIMGCQTRIDVRISALAFEGANLLLDRIPAWGRTEELLIDTHANLYDYLMHRQQEGRLPAEPAARTEIIADFVDALAGSWRRGAEQGRSMTLVGKTLQRLRPKRQAPQRS